MCVQRFDDSLNSAIRITYRISLRSSSMPEPRDPLLKVLVYLTIFRFNMVKKNLLWATDGHWPEVEDPRRSGQGRARQSNMVVIQRVGDRA